MISKTQQLVTLLERNAKLTHVDSHARVAGWLTSLLEEFEKEYKSVSDRINVSMLRVKLLNYDASNETNNLD
jgi:hypothetical protein